MAKLEVELGADVAELQSKLADAIKGLKQLQNESKALDAQFKKGKISADDYYGAIARNTTEIDKASLNVNNLKKSILGSDNAIRGMGKSTANATPAMMEFSRVIQDAPYGIMGVGNNIQQLTANFGHLSASAGGTIPALKAMVSSLAGPAGILLAVSAVTTVLTVFSKEIFGASEKEKELAESTKNTNSELTNQKTILEDLTKDFSTFNKIKAKSTFNTIKEREELKSLSANVLDYTLTEEQRSRILKELTENYGKYYEGIKINETNKLIKAEEAVNQVLLRREKRLQTLNKLELTGQAIQNNLIELGQKRASVKKEDIDRVKFLDTEILKLQTLQTELRNALEGYASFDLNLEGKGKVNLDKETINKSVQAIGLQMNTALAELPITTPINILGSTITEFDRQALEMQGRMLDFANKMQEIKDTSLTNAFIGIGDAIGGALANGGNVLQAIGMSLLRSFGGFLSQMGAQMILYGKLAIAKGKLDLAIAAGGGAAIVAGLASVKMGILVAAAGAAVGALASGGFGGSSRSNAGTSTGSSGGGFTGGFSSGGGNQRVVFEIAGRKLIGVIQNEIRAQGNSGVNFAF